MLSKARGLAVTAVWPDPVTTTSVHPPILLLNPIWGRAGVCRPDSVLWEGWGTCVLISSSLWMAPGWCTGSATCYQEHCFQSTHNDNKMKYYSNDVLHETGRDQIISVTFFFFYYYYYYYHFFLQRGDIGSLNCYLLLYFSPTYVYVSEKYIESHPQTEINIWIIIHTCSR